MNELKDMAFFSLFILLYLFFPGALLLKAANIRLKDDSTCNRMLLAFFVGFALLTAEYYLCSLVNAFWLFAAISPAILLIYLLKNFKSVLTVVHSKWQRQDKFKTTAFIFVLTCIFAVSFMYTTFKMGNILSNEYVTLGQDYFNHVGLVAALSKGLPAQDLKVSGVTLYYHYFQDLLFGMCANIFPVSAINLVVNCTPVMVTVTLGLSVFCLLKPENVNGKYTAKDLLRTILGCALLFLFGGAWSEPINGRGYESGIANWHNSHVFTSVNACAFAIGAIIALLIMIKNMDLTKLHWGNLIVFAMLVFTATGGKGPFAIVFVAAFAGTYIVKILTERNWNKAMLVYVLVACVTFALTYLLVIQGTSQYGQSLTTQMEISLTGTLKRSAIAGYSNAGLLAIPGIGTLMRLLLLIFFGFGPLLIYAIFVAADELKNIFQKQKVDVYSCVSLAMIAIGAVGFVCVNQSGYSQVYFLFVAIPSLVHLVLRYTDSLPKGIKWRSVCFIVLVSLFGLNMFVADAKVHTKAGLSYREWFGYETAAAVPSLSNISSEEVDGLLWLRENTPGDTVVLTDRRSLTPNDDYLSDCRFFGYSAISERQMFIEGFSYSSVSQEEIKKKIDITNEIYASSGAAAEQLLRENAIDYVIVTKRMGTQFHPETDSVQLCFENDQMQIYGMIK